MSSSSSQRADPPPHSIPAHLVPKRGSSKAHNQLWSSNMAQKVISDSNKRKVSIQSQLSTSSSINDFVTAKVEDMEGNVEDLTAIYGLAEKALQTGVMSRKDFVDLTRDIHRRRSAMKVEVLHVKKQRKIIQEDLEDQLLSSSNFSRVEGQYAAMFAKSVARASSKVSSPSGFNRSAFTRDVGEYLGAYRKVVINDQAITDEGKYEESWWCHVLAKWFPPKQVKAAHLVPKSLNGPELAYAFGVDEMSMNDPRLGITIHDLIEDALDRGNIAFVPVSKDGQNLRWKVVLANEAIANKTGPQDMRWREIDGTFLTFRGENRPARRYFYFRYLMTYFECLREDKSVAWAQTSENKGYVWATPGPYLRRGMLAVLAKVAGDVYEPEAWEMHLKQTTFEDHEFSPKLDNATVVEYARSLSWRMEQTVREARAEFGSEDDTEES